MKRLFFCLLVLLFAADLAAGQSFVITGRMHHLRVGDVPEWDVFPRTPEGSRLEERFAAEPNANVRALRLEQQDVKQAWRVNLNGQTLGQLIQDEKNIVVYLTVPAGLLEDGENILSVESESTIPDDIRVGRITLLARSPDEIFSEAAIDVSVMDVDTGKPLPSRITVVDDTGALHTVGAASNDSLAVRPGVVYTGTGRAAFGLPAGTYTIYAGRGFEYGMDSVRVTLHSGERTAADLAIRREVPTRGFVATDTHIHTLTHGGHGDATIAERMLTLAGEGIELPISTEHNKYIDFESAAVEAGVRSYFTPVMGSEVTTRTGHFNIFPVASGAPLADFEAPDWPSLFENIYNISDVRAVILNHGRDIHSGFRPFDPAHHRSVAGERTDGRELRANAMEIINSGATQTDGMRLVHDWFGLYNRGYQLTPVGASDAHDVIRYIVGQGRTYIKAQDDFPDRIDVNEAVQHFIEGRVMVSFGLMAEITVDSQYGPGDLVPASDSIDVTVRVLGPGWTTADRVELFANGQVVREVQIKDGDKPGIKWESTWRLPRPAHDVFLSAVAHGPGIEAPYWRIEKPYQPAAPTWESYVLGISGAVRIDADGDGQYQSAFDYARKMVETSGDDLPALMRLLETCDEAVAIQAASILAAHGTPPSDPRVQSALASAAPPTRRGFEAFLEAWNHTNYPE